MPIQLRKADLARKGLELLAAGKLQCDQEPAFQCRYRGPRTGSPCIVGALLTDRQAAYLDKAERTAIESLIIEELIETDDDFFFVKAQELHDRIAHAKMHNDQERERAYRKGLMALLQSGLPND